LQAMTVSDGFGIIGNGPDLEMILKNAHEPTSGPATWAVPKC
jgi:hypothetical protein